MKEFKININNQTRYLRYNDLPGEKTPLIFIPGWGCSGSFDFVECASQVGLRNHRRILIDLLGSGYSDKPEDFDYLPESHANYIKKLLDSLNIDKFIIYAHSMGGRIALSLANLYKNKVQAMILCEGSMVKEFFPYMDQGEKVFVEEKFPKMISKLETRDNQMFPATCRICSPQGLYRSAREMMSEESSKWSKMFFSAPYKKVFIVGEDTDDEGFNLEDIANNKIPIITVKGAGHTMNWDLPLETSQAILRGLKILDQ